MVSVVIPAYNRESSIKKAIESVLNQSYEDIEVIIVDDGSKDNTRQIVNSIDDKRLKYFYQDNAGACAARNKGISLACGEYIAFHDSDDIWHKSKLEKQMNALLKNNADIVFCKLIKYHLNGDSEIFGNSYKEGFLNPVSNLLGIGTQTLLAKRKVFDNCIFDEEFQRFQEFELLLRLSKNYSIYCVDEGLVDYFVGNDSISSSADKLYNACELLLVKHPEILSYPVMKRKFSGFLLQGAKTQRRNNKQFMKYIRLSAKYDTNIKWFMKSVSILLGIE